MTPTVLHFRSNLFEIEKPVREFYATQEDIVPKNPNFENSETHFDNRKRLSIRLNKLDHADHGRHTECSPPNPE